jgi:hypothetical protein
MEFADHDIAGNPHRTRRRGVAAYRAPNIVIHILAPVLSELLRILGRVEPGSKLIEQRVASARVQNCSRLGALFEFVGELTG